MARTPLPIVPLEAEPLGVLPSELRRVAAETAWMPPLRYQRVAKGRLIVMVKLPGGLRRVGEVVRQAGAWVPVVRGHAYPAPTCALQHPIDAATLRTYEIAVALAAGFSADDPHNEVLRAVHAWEGVPLLAGLSL